MAQPRRRGICGARAGVFKLAWIITFPIIIARFVKINLLAYRKNISPETSYGRQSKTR